MNNNDPGYVNYEAIIYGMSERSRRGRGEGRSGREGGRRVCWLLHSGVIALSAIDSANRHNITAICTGYMPSNSDTVISIFVCCG